MEFSLLFKFLFNFHSKDNNCCCLQGYYLHYNFVVALLNDLFGIQSRGGCMCAGPYGQHLLGIDLDLSHSYEKLLLEDRYVSC